MIRPALAAHNIRNVTKHIQLGDYLENARVKSATIVFLNRPFRYGRSKEGAMAYITTGLTNGGVTTHYKFSYDQALGGPGGPEPARTNAVIAACEGDYNLMSGWFGGGLVVTGMSVQVTTQSNGASWSGTSTSSTIQLKAQGASYSNNPAYLRYLIIAEVTEIFMMTQGTGWFQGGDEGSKGEGLSRFLSSQFLALNGFLGVGIDADYAVADLWLNSSRQDFVNNAPNDNGYDATNGCTTLFIYYLFSQLGFSIKQIVGAAAATLAGVYKNLSGDSNDPFPLFKEILGVWFPSQTSSAVHGPILTIHGRCWRLPIRASGAPGIVAIISGATPSRQASSPSGRRSRLRIFD
jgi:hypothetical protein